MRIVGAIAAVLRVFPLALFHSISPPQAREKGLLPVLILFWAMRRPTLHPICFMMLFRAL